MMATRLIVLLSLISAMFCAPLVNCSQNVLTYLSSYTLGRQHDLNKTFVTLQPIVKVPSFNYTPRIGKEYIIESMTLNYFIINSKEISQFRAMNQQTISGAVLRLNYNFTWQKKQLGSSVRGTAEGVVLSDGFNFTKFIGIANAQPQQYLKQAKNVTFTNQFPVSKVSPYSQNDSQTLFIMMNTAVNHEAGKDVIINAINEHFASVLNETIQNDSSQLSVSKTLNYSYFDYRGQYKVNYDSPIVRFDMDGHGTSFMTSQVISDDPNFECAESFIDGPVDRDAIGGKQNVLSNSLLKSTVKYILSKGFFNIKLNQQNWESRAFQFYAGDLYLAIPNIKKNKVNPDTVITGDCSGANDESFNFSVKSSTQYQVAVNFSCTLQMANQTISKFTILANSVINVTLRTTDLMFVIHSITGTPVFSEVTGYTIQNLDFAKFLVTETLKVASGSHTFGTGYRTLQREHPYVRIEKDYLLLYDPSYLPDQPVI